MIYLYQFNDVKIYQLQTIDVDKCSHYKSIGLYQQWIHDTCNIRRIHNDTTQFRFTVIVKSFFSDLCLSLNLWDMICPIRVIEKITAHFKAHDTRVCETRSRLLPEGQWASGHKERLSIFVVTVNDVETFMKIIC